MEVLVLADRTSALKMLAKLVSTKCYTLGYVCGEQIC